MPLSRFTTPGRQGDWEGKRLGGEQEQKGGGGTEERAGVGGQQAGWGGLKQRAANHLGGITSFRNQGHGKES